MLKLQLPLRLRLRFAVQAGIGRALDVLYSPVLTRATDEEYFSSVTRNELLAKFVRNRVRALAHGGGSAG